MQSIGDFEYDLPAGDEAGRERGDMNKQEPEAGITDIGKYEILLDPADRFVIWDLGEGLPVATKDGVFSYGTLREAERAIMELLRAGKLPPA